MLMQKLKGLIVISTFCLLSILSFGQNSKSIVPNLERITDKNAEQRINHNVNTKNSFILLFAQC